MASHGTAPIHDPRVTFQELYGGRRGHMQQQPAPNAVRRQTQQADPPTQPQPTAKQPPGRASEIVPQRLFFVLVAAQPHDTQRSHYFSVDTSLLYESFFEDFGPLHLAKTKRFLDLVDAKLHDPSNTGRSIYMYSMFHDRQAATNASCLAALYAVLRVGMPPQDALQRVSNWAHCWTPFLDASPGGHSEADPPFGLTLSDVVCGVHRAIVLHRWVDMTNFDPLAYEASEQIVNGDWNWIVPGESLAFSGPGGPHTVYTVPQYVQLFRALGVTTIVRLNEAFYDAQQFTSAGFEFVDLFFPDGSTPSRSIVERFLALYESQQGRKRVLAVHCKAGLGRTGTLIALRMMQVYGFSAREAMGWLRICRPGSVLGPQQAFLCDMERAAEQQQQQPQHATEAPPPPQPPQLPLRARRRSASNSSTASRTASRSRHTTPKRRGSGGSVATAASGGGGAGGDSTPRRSVSQAARLRGRSPRAGGVGGQTGPEGGWSHPAHYLQAPSTPGLGGGNVNTIGTVRPVQKRSRSGSQTQRGGKENGLPGWWAQGAQGGVQGVRARTTNVVTPRASPTPEGRPNVTALQTSGPRHIPNTCGGPSVRFANGAPAVGCGVGSGSMSSANASHCTTGSGVHYAPSDVRFTQLR